MADPDSSALMARLRAEQSRLAKILIAANTIRGYDYDCKQFATWCNRLGRAPLPASSDTVGLYVASQLSDGLKVSTVTRRLAAIAHIHRANDLPSPVTADVRMLLRGAKRDHTRIEDVHRVCPLSIEELRSIARLLMEEDTPMSIRDRAILVVGFASALRSANLACLTMADVEFCEKGVKLQIRRSKTDQEGRGATLGLPHGRHPETCPVTALRDWMARRGAYAGPVFTRFGRIARRHIPLEAERIGQIVQHAVARIGLESEKYSGHSLRSGMVTASVEQNIDELLIMAQTLHHDRRSLAAYFRRRDVFHSAVALLDL